VPTPEEAIAHADSLHIAARNELGEHLQRTGEMHPGLLKRAMEAQRASAIVRAAAAHAELSPEVHAKARDMVADFYDRLPRTFITGADEKGRVNFQALSPEQFESYSAGGPWPR
jgi:hypothetical protein